MKMNHMKSMMTVALMAGIAGCFSAGLASAEAEYAPSSRPKSVELDTKPGPAFTTIDGKVSKIEGNIYVVEGPAYNAIGGGANCPTKYASMSAKTPRRSAAKKEWEIRFALS